MIDRTLRSTNLSVYLAIGSAIALSVVLIAASSTDPLSALYHFFLGPFSSRFHLGNLLDGASLLMLSGLGAILAFRGGAFNLGGEGQSYLAALLASQLALGPAITRYSGVSIGLILLIAALSAGTLAAVSGILRETLGIDELISSFLLSSALLPLVDQAIAGPLRDKTGYLLATPPIAEGVRLARLLPPSTLSGGLAISLIVVLSLCTLFHRSLAGFELRMAGSSRRFARYAGVLAGKYLVISMFLSGALHGIAGGLHVLGTRYSGVQGGTAGIGWNGIAVALIAENRSFAVIPAALAFSYLDTATTVAMINTGFPFEITAIVQGTVLIVVTVRRVRKTPATGT